MFAEFREREAAKQRKHVVFLLTHNTYTQVSSECGIPALIIFVAILVSIFRTAKRIHRLSRKRPEPSIDNQRKAGGDAQDRLQGEAVAETALALRYSVLAYATTSFFLSVAYQALLPTLAGMVAALEYSVARQLAVAPASKPVPVQPPVTAVGMTVQTVPVVGYATLLKSRWKRP
jgi:O-antigen ligase